MELVYLSDSAHFAVQHLLPRCLGHGHVSVFGKKQQSIASLLEANDFTPKFLEPAQSKQ
jgi:hypothetical protein